MRLTHLKLAGFKSFVDTTTLHIHGQRVGVVGPNGCGKSNVMESVRWVLGESSAKEMRADAMDAVIFNGSGNRKPISRASVELIFDNSLGGATGEWSQYAEISVKRVIEREKGSTYFINNSVVRRRDVADLFLGTGLGGRAYAIIGQNTINRIVEAKPEELRVFLEEAAGVSKYKERRRETELRLRDTRDNLSRVEDLLLELDKQIARLQSQAIIAEQYHQLQSALKLAKAQLWLLKKRDAAAKWDKAQRQVEQLAQSLEAQLADLRANEAALEIARQQNFAAMEAVNVKQAQYYAVNAEVSNLELQVKNTADARDRLQIQLHQLLTQQEKNLDQISHLKTSVVNAEAELVNVELIDTKLEADTQAAKAVLPSLTEQFKAKLAALNHIQASLISVEQDLRLEQTNINHLARNHRETTELITRLSNNIEKVPLSSEETLAEKAQLLESIGYQVQALEQSVTDSGVAEQSLDVEVKKSRDSLTHHQRALNLIDAEINSLTKIQQSMKHAENETALNAWLAEVGLDSQQRLWQFITVKKGWETALEAVLSNKLNALINHASTFLKARPPGALTVVKTSRLAIKHSEKTSQPLLIDLIEIQHEGLKNVLQDWLCGACVLASEVEPEQAVLELKTGEYLVNQQGDIYTPHSVTYYGTQSLLHGVLERQALLNQLESERPLALNAVTNAELLLSNAEHNLKVTRAEHHLKRQQLKDTIQQQHQQSLVLQQLKQSHQNALHRLKSLQDELESAELKLLKLNSESADRQSIVANLGLKLSHIKSEKSALEIDKQKAESALHYARNQLQNLERAYQESQFNIKLKNNSIIEINHRVNMLSEESQSLKQRYQEAEAMLAATKMETLNANLALALNQKHTSEAVLIEARNHMSECELALMGLERAKMQNEQLLHPIRDKLEASRLTEQEARIHFEQCQMELTACNMNEAELIQQVELLESNRDGVVKVTELEKLRNKLTLDIEALGAVNLAAIQELEAEKTRKTYLDSQCKDLIDASMTLEDAIKKIDKETRGRLQATFDEANRHFAELFTTLFGGGQARLEMLGEEILDTGMQVFAQPPGKKNSTIHLLSGGEKALTALALVFALFRLNPAPFCLMDEVDAPLDDSNTERFCAMVKKMSEKTQFLYVSHNKITMEMAQQLIGVTMQESGVSRIVDVDMEDAIKLAEA